MVCCLDEFVVGFACDNSRGPNHGARMVFTKEGALIANAAGVIDRDWKWDASAQNAGSPPPVSVVSWRVLRTSLFYLVLRS